MFIKVLNTSRFAIVRESILLLKRCTPKHVDEAYQELGGGELSYSTVRARVPGAGNRPPQEGKTSQIPGGMSGGAL